MRITQTGEARKSSKATLDILNKLRREGLSINDLVEMTMCSGIKNAISYCSTGRRYGQFCRSTSEFPVPVYMDPEVSANRSINNWPLVMDMFKFHH